MGMRAPKTEATGTSGQSFVKAHFEKLGWGVMPNPEHDLGTDMIVQARDDGGFDLGLLLGVQVKSGSSYFDEPCELDGKHTGWWFREDQDHFDYWLGYQAAHIVVLHDQDSGIAYWVHVADDQVEITGVGRKILVPVGQTVDAGHLAELVKVAESKTRSPHWEGSVWDISAQIPDAAKLRYALVTPRLLGPHPNAKVEDFAAEQAIGLAVQMRLHDIERLKDEWPLLDPSAASESEDWAWRLYGALRDWLSTGKRDGLDALVSTASTPAQHVAVAVCVSHAMLEDGDSAGALEVIETGLAFDGLSPADRHWLQAHKSRIDYELGELDGAREMALSVKQIDKSLHGDPTVRVLLGSASQLVFNLGDWSPESLADVVRGRDNMANLWRNQVISEGLGKQAEDTFRKWARDNSVTFGATDVPWLRFRSAMLLSGYAADTPGWRYAASLLARRQLLSSGDEDIPEWVFELLRLSGSDKDLRLVATRLLNVGPVEPLVEAASQLDLGRSTRSSLQASITLIEKSADLVSTEVGDRHTKWALGVLSGTDDTLARLKPQFFVGDALLNMLRALWRSTSATSKDDVKLHILGLPPIEDQLVAGGYARLMARIEEDAWSDDEVAQLATRATGDNFELTEAIERLRASRSPDFRSSLLDRIAAGDLKALSSYGTVTDLPETVARGAIQNLAEKVSVQTESARNGAYGIGGPDLLRDLVLLNVWHPDQADWRTCYDALVEPNMIPDHLKGCIDLVTAVAAEIDDPVRDALRGPLEQIRDRGSFPSAFDQSSAEETMRGAATVALALMFPDTVGAELLTRLVRGDVGQRSAAARILVEREDEASLVTLAALTRDLDLEVRSLVAGGLARWVAKGVAPDASLRLVTELLLDPGVEMGRAVAGAVTGEIAPDRVRSLVSLLVDHPSAAVRAHVSRVAAESGSS